MRMSGWTRGSEDQGRELAVGCGLGNADWQACGEQRSCQGWEGRGQTPGSTALLGRESPHPGPLDLPGVSLLPSVTARWVWVTSGLSSEDPDLPSSTPDALALLAPAVSIYPRDIKGRLSAES